MTEIIKWIGKISITAVFWVFILSIQVQGRPLFFLAHETLIENKVVRQLDEYIVDLWGKAKETAMRTYEEMSGNRPTTF